VQYPKENFYPMLLKLYENLNFITFFLFLFFLIIIPTPLSVSKFIVDLLFHFLYFFIFSLFCEKKHEKIFIILLPLLTEIIQYFIPYRNFSIYDIFSGYAGIFIGLITYEFILKDRYERFRFLGSGFTIGLLIPAGKATFSGLLALLIFIYFPISKFTLTLIIIFIYLLHFILRDFLEGKDPDFFIIDEVAGVLPCFYLDSEPFFYVIYFLIWRFFDIKKPLFIKRVEEIKNFNGVFLDDFISGIYSFIITFIFQFLLKKLII